MRQVAGFALSGLAIFWAAGAMTQAPAGGTGAANNDANRQICRTFRANGSRLGGERVCRTAAEWADLRRQTRENIDRIQTRQSINADPTGQ